LAIVFCSPVDVVSGEGYLTEFLYIIARTIRAQSSAVEKNGTDDGDNNRRRSTSHGSQQPALCNELSLSNKRVVDIPRLPVRPVYRSYRVCKERDNDSFDSIQFGQLLGVETK